MMYLWRRSKLGLKFSPEQREALAQFMTGATAGYGSDRLQKQAIGINVRRCGMRGIGWR